MLACKELRRFHWLGGYIRPREAVKGSFIQKVLWMAGISAPAPIISDLDIAERTLASSIKAPTEKKKKKAPSKKTIKKKKSVKQLATENQNKLPWR